MIADRGVREQYCRADFDFEDCRKSRKAAQERRLTVEKERERERERGRLSVQTWRRVVSLAGLQYHSRALYSVGAGEGDWLESRIRRLFYEDWSLIQQQGSTDKYWELAFQSTTEVR